MKIVSVNKSEKKGTVKLPISKGFFKIDHGLVGDAHAAPGKRQVSLLAKEDYAIMEKTKDLPLGSFAENLTTEGIVLHTLPVGTQMRIGTTLVELSQIGKTCHQGCAIRDLVGNCVMPKRGVFVIIKEEGEIKAGDEIVLLE